MGRNGITPAYKEGVGGRKRFSFFRGDEFMKAFAGLGLALSSFQFLSGSASVLTQVATLFLYNSISSVGSVWYSFGWESLLYECTWLSVFAVPALLPAALIPGSSASFASPPSLIVVYLYRWLAFRVMIGSGLIKFRSGDPNWKNLTTMNYFYATQPCPNPLSKFFHKLPSSWHSFEVIVNHFTEIVAPAFLLCPIRRLRIPAAVMQLLFQTVLILGGNLAFLNWLTMAAMLWCLDDTFLEPLFGMHSKFSKVLADYTISHRPGGGRVASALSSRSLVSAALLAFVVKLSVPVVKNLLSKDQVMNGSFDKYKLVNTYGAFGVVSEERRELIVSGADGVDGPWLEYEFKIKPGDINRRPRFISPYHYRLDWCMWIATFGGIERNQWLYSFLLKLAENDEAVTSLLQRNPWEGKEAGPKYLRIEEYIYEYSDEGGSGDEAFEEGKWWRRKFNKRYCPAQGILTEEALRGILSPSET